MSKTSKIVRPTGSLSFSGALFLIAYIISCSFLSFQYLKNGELNYSLVLSLPLFLLAQITRAFRFYTLLEERKARFYDFILSFFVGDALGGLTNKFLGEVYKIFLLNKFQPGRLAKLILCFIYTRFLDAVFFVLVFSVMLLKFDDFKVRLFLILTIFFVTGALLMLLAFDKLTHRMLIYFTVDNHSAISTRIVTFLHNLRDAFLSIKANKIDSFAIGMVLTVCIWAFEFSAILSLNSSSLFSLDADENTIEVIVGNIGGTLANTIVGASGFYAPLYVALFFISCVLLLPLISKRTPKP